MTTEQQLPSNVSDLSGDDEMSEIMEALAANVAPQSPDVDWRQDVPEGTVIAETEVDGHKIQLTKGKSGVRLGQHQLRERTRVYDTRTGVSSDVPTAQLWYQLGKRRSDGSRVYSLKFPAGVKMPEPIDATCSICTKNRGGRKKLFYEEDQIRAHFLAFHPDEWAAMERQIDRDEARANAARMEKLIEGIAAFLPGTQSNKDAKIVGGMTDEERSQMAQLIEQNRQLLARLETLEAQAPAATQADITTPDDEKVVPPKKGK